MSNPWITAKEASKILGVTHRHILKLIKTEKIQAKLENTPVPYYLVNKASLLTYKATPKNKGGRPKTNM